MPKPLEGIRIIEWAMFHNGPATGYMLGDLGADVIKIEDTVRGDAFRGMSQIYGETLSLPGGRIIGFESANRSKRGITLNLKTEQGRHILYRMVEGSDVFLTNFRRSVARRLGVDYEALSQVNPKIIYAWSTGYGERGPMAGRRGFDTVAQARSGLMWTVGDRDHTEPYQTAAAPCDQGGATMLAYGIMAALLARERHGTGQEIHVSLLGSSLHLQAIGLNVTGFRGRSYARHSRARARNPMANQYRCADGKWLMLAEAQSDRFWSEFCSVMGLEHLIEDPRFATSREGRRVHYAELIQILDQVFAARTRDEWVRHFEERKVQFAYSPIYDYQEVLEDPQALENNYIVEFEHPTAGRVKTIGCPVQFSKTPAGISRPAPEFGEHTEEVLLEIGYTWEDIARFKAEGVI